MRVRGVTSCGAPQVLILQTCYFGGMGMLFDRQARTISRKIKETAKIVGVNKRVAQFSINVKRVGFMLKAVSVSLVIILSFYLLQTEVGLAIVDPVTYYYVMTCLWALPVIGQTGQAFFLMNSYQPSEAQRERVQQTRRLANGPRPLERWDSGAVASMKHITVTVPDEGANVLKHRSDLASPSAGSDATPDSARETSVRFEGSARFDSSQRASPGPTRDPSLRWDSTRVSAESSVGSNGEPSRSPAVSVSSDGKRASPSPLKRAASSFKVGAKTIGKAASVSKFDLFDPGAFDLVDASKGADSAAAAVAQSSAASVASPTTRTVADRHAEPPAAAIASAPAQAEPTPSEPAQPEPVLPGDPGVPTNEKSADSAAEKV